MFTDPAVQRLWDAGQILAAYEASSVPAGSGSAHPFRDQLAALDIARQWHEHGLLCWYNARRSEAETAFEHAYTTRRDVLGEHHADTLDTFERQAALAGEPGQPHALAMFEKVIAGLTAAFDDDHLRVAIARRNFAAYLRDLHEYERAREVADRAAAVIQRALPPAHPDVIAMLKMKALLAADTKAYEQAIALGLLAMELGKRVWSEAHPFVAAAELTVATAELRSGQIKNARKRFPSICRRLELAYGEHPLVARTLWRQVQLDLAGEFGLQQAEQDMRRAIAIYRDAYAPANAVALECTLFEVLAASRQMGAAAELAEEIFDRAPDIAKYGMAGRLANYSWGRDQQAAIRWAERASAAAGDEEKREAWEAWTARARGG